MMDLTKSPAQLKSSILKDAMMGKLTRQLPEDGDAKDLLAQINAEKDALIKAKKIKKQKALPEIEDDEIPFEIPDNWKWVRMESILSFDKGAIRRGPFGSSITKSMFVPQSANSYKVYEQGNAIRKSIDYGNYYISKDKFNELESFKIKSGDIIISCAGTIGKTYVLPEDCPEGVINQALIRIRLNEKIIDKKFFLLMFQQKISLIYSQAVGSAIKNMASIKTLKNDILWQLPPLSEQKRIVSKLDSLLPKVDEFNHSVEQLHNLREELPSRLRRSFLQSAMMGQLTKQLPEDGDASDLLEKIKAEKETLVKAKKIKAQKTLPEIAADEIPFEIPDNWRWVRLGEIANYIQKGKTPKYTESGVPVINQRCVRWTGIEPLNFSYISENEFNKYSRDRILKPGDILWNTTGNGTLGRLSITTKSLIDMYNNIVVSGDVMIIRINEHIDSNYVFNYLSSDTIQNHLKDIVTGSTNQIHLNLSAVTPLLVPLPPLSEQNRIVNKLDKLLDELKG